MKMRRPIPIADSLSADFWRAAAQHRLVIARCSVCDSFSHPPNIICVYCGSVDPDFCFHPVSGNATVRSWTVVRQALLPGFEADVPYVIVDVELDEQPDLRMTGRLVDGVGAPVAVGARVHLVFEDIAEGIAVPAFQLEDKQV